MTGPDGTGAPVPDAPPDPAALYSLPLGEFTAARNELARQARARGDRGAAAAIARLAKPSLVAWLANQLARQHPADVESLTGLGERLREATAALDAAALRRLSGEQRQLIATLSGQARDLASAAGQAFSDSTSRGLEDTLHAALADPAAARELAAGQLTAGLSRSGFAGLDALAPPPAPPARPRSAPKPGASGREAPVARDAAAGQGASAGRDRKAAAARRAADREEAAAAARRERLAAARKAEAAARQRATTTAAELEQSQAALSRAESAARAAAADADRLQDELDAALTARDAAGQARREARHDVDRAERADRAARRRLDQAIADHAALDD